MIKIIVFFFCIMLFISCENKDRYELKTNIEGYRSDIVLVDKQTGKFYIFKKLSPKQVRVIDVVKKTNGLYELK